MFERRLFSISLALTIAAMGAMFHSHLAAQTIAPRPNVAITKIPELTYNVWPADFNEDGVTDLVAGQPGGQLVLVIGTGSGTFGAASLIAGGPLRPLTVGDFDADGFIDVLAATPRTEANPQPDIHAFRGNGNGTFAAPIPVATDVATTDILGGLEADFDADSHRDFAALTTNRVLLYSGHGDFAFDAPAVLATDPLAGGMIAADFDGNGQTDVAVATASGVDLFMHTGGFLFTFGLIRLEPAALSVTAWDMNGDGPPDLVVSAATYGNILSLGPWLNGYVFMLLGNGDGTFQPPARFDTNIGPTTVVAGDFSGDGAPDVATGHQSYGVACDSWSHLWDSVSILPGLGAGQLGPAATFALGNSEELSDHLFYRRDHRSLKTSDLNADGRTDLIASPGAILRSTPPAANSSPLADAGTPRNVTFGALPYVLGGSAVDPDSDWLSFQWTDESGAVIGTVPRPCIGTMYTDSQTFTLTVADGRGGVSVDTVTYTFGSVVEPPSTLLPVSLDIGTVASSGHSSFDGTSYTVHGSGVDIWGTADGFHYVHGTVQGDFEITARVTAVDDIHRWTKAGVMVRETSDASSRHAFVFSTPTALNGVGFQRRPVEGGVTLHTAGAPVAPPGWLRLRREGDVVSAFHRQSESDAWALVGTQTFGALAQEVSVGLAVTSHVDGTLATATFDNVTITTAAPDEWTSVDVGAVGAAGSGSSSGSTHTVRGSGADIWDVTDAFHYRYQTRAGDFQIAALVSSVENVHRWTKAGLMVREGLEPGARHASVFATPTTEKGLAFQRRPVANESSVHTAGPPLTAPVWILLDRTGDTVSGYFSSSGTADSWTLIDSQSFPGLGDTLQVGLAVTSHVDGNLATAVFEAVTLSGSVSWHTSDIGAIGIGGSEVSSGPSQLTMQASGADIWGDADAFRFRHAAWSGDGTITVRVASIENTHRWAKAGVMFRETLDPSAKQVMTVVTPTNGVAMQYRAEAGQASIHAASLAATAPEWLRLTRRGDEFTGYASEDGVTWAMVGQATVAMSADVYVGLALTSHDNATLATAGFENWQVQRDEPVPPASFAITTPAPASTLRATAITFDWQGAGDEFWLDIGTAPGRSDLYASGSLGMASHHTVTGLPLNGMTLHVRLRRRVGSLVESIDAQYTAPIRKGLAIITDFADRRLEDWTGAGMSSVEDVAAELGRMEDHWAWLSRGGEAFQWDIIRIQLPQAAVPDAYRGWVEFRNAVITLARQQVDTADYDVNSDGVIDTSWIIVSAVGELSYAIGGSSRNAGANCFVDGQASTSVVAQATGNFTHEVGHNLGLPDMYGTYGTLDTLTVMAFSWPVPPTDFAAYERLTLGWLDPQVVSQTTRDVWLPSANTTFAAAMIPTSQPAEYFLIEYRTRPASGFGSATPEFNGLAVYHVLEGSSSWTYPPLVKLEPADGAIEYSQPLDPLDLVYPENPVLLRPMVLRTYSTGEEVFRIENVAWRDGGLAFDVVMPSP